MEGGDKNQFILGGIENAIFTWCLEDTILMYMESRECDFVAYEGLKNAYLL